MTKAEFYNIIDELIEQEPGTVAGDETLADLEGWDSLSVVAFIAAVDKHLSFTVSPKGLGEATTVRDLMDLLGEAIVE